MGPLAGTRGRLLAADSSPEVLSGKWPHDKLVLLQFPDRAEFERWARSPEYVVISTDRIAATTGSVVLVAGIAPPAPVHRGHAELEQPNRSASPTVPSKHDAA